MKKSYLAAALFSGILSLNAQETAVISERQNDIMISPIELIAVPALNVSYERLLNESSASELTEFFTSTMMMKITACRKSHLITECILVKNMRRASL